MRTEGDKNDEESAALPDDDEVEGQKKTDKATKTKKPRRSAKDKESKEGKEGKEGEDPKSKRGKKGKEPVKVGSSSGAAKGQSKGKQTAPKSSEFVVDSDTEQPGEKPEASSSTKEGKKAKKLTVKDLRQIEREEGRLAMIVKLKKAQEAMKAQSSKDASDAATKSGVSPTPASGDIQSDEGPSASDAMDLDTEPGKKGFLYVLRIANVHPTVRS